MKEAPWTRPREYRWSFNLDEKGNWTAGETWEKIRLNDFPYVQVWVPQLKR